MNLNTISMPWQASPTNPAILYIPNIRTMGASS
jgi:hypothetical protein